MRCPERTRLFDHLERTAKAFAEAVGGLRDLTGFDLIAQQKLVGHVRAACNAAEAALADHEKTHGCAGLKANETATGGEIVMRR